MPSLSEHPQRQQLLCLESTLFPSKLSPVDSPCQKSGPGLKNLEGDTPTNNQLSAMNKFPWVVSSSGQKPRQEVVKEPLLRFLLGVTVTLWGMSLLFRTTGSMTMTSLQSLLRAREEQLIYIYTHTTFITIYWPGKSAAQSCWDLQGIHRVSSGFKALL